MAPGARGVGALEPKPPRAKGDACSLDIPDAQPAKRDGGRRLFFTTIVDKKWLYSSLVFYSRSFWSTYVTNYVSMI